MNKIKILTLISKILTILVIPLVLWIVITPFVACKNSALQQFLGIKDFMCHKGEYVGSSAPFDEYGFYLLILLIVILIIRFFLHSKTNKTESRAVKISLSASIIGAFYIIGFIPDNLSCIDLEKSSTFFTAICLYLPIQFIVVLLLQWIFKSKFSYYVLTLFLGVYWIFIHKYEFTYRVACWSTFSEKEIWEVVLFDAGVPLFACLITFSILYKVLNEERKK
ncbi:hypothetical protein QJU89_03100 [Pasteurella skyensis]|uniref:Uncharacterized protein n=1 Tax=Phocoenobacter skyensis TaxID=97481 RepID=A0AAJ6P132_9PAST|nr:hypothetical protein [Pasteurella skyensis]MDP8163221.1 hypothetical protein [Pasteurella skyensis]MDP8173312.1 hypothetical protein [Pasteurella skyensis]MDP8176983.1 hypothetical protein [Pasteurella skyensis]MDP8179722.1 hypothetical protein [Pasteurella skyensis]MDP8182685.1 hypothetical protein [Pasteurella skyensis]